MDYTTLQTGNQQTILNIRKTKYITFSSKNKLQNKQNFVLRFNNKPIEQVKTTFFFGVLLHKSLS